MADAHSLFATNSPTPHRSGMRLRVIAVAVSALATPVYAASEERCAQLWGEYRAQHDIFNRTTTGLRQSPEARAASQKAEDAGSMIRSQGCSVDDPFFDDNMKMFHALNNTPVQPEPNNEASPAMAQSAACVADKTDMDAALPPATPGKPPDIDSLIKSQEKIIAVCQRMIDDGCWSKEKGEAAKAFFEHLLHTSQVAKERFKDEEPK
jgi:hypothetical protein